MNLRVADLLKAQIQSHEPSVQLESASSKRKAEQGAQIPKRQAAGVRGGAGLPPQQPETETIAALPVTTTPDKGSGNAAAAP